jgi:hypothetical protein
MCVRGRDDNVLGVVVSDVNSWKVDIVAHILYVLFVMVMDGSLVFLVVVFVNLVGHYYFGTRK